MIALKDYLWGNAGLIRIIKQTFGNLSGSIEIRTQQFESGRYPSSALITVVGFVRPELMIEIKATAVVGEEAGAD